MGVSAEQGAGLTHSRARDHQTSRLDQFAILTFPQKLIFGTRTGTSQVVDSPPGQPIKVNRRSENGSQICDLPTLELVFA